jgi:midasin
LYPDIPTSIIEVALALMKTLDKSGRTAMDENTRDLNTADETAAVMDSRSLCLYSGGRSPSVRDFFKLLSRISNGICFERNVTYVTESQRMICLTESVEILVGSCPDVDMRHDFVTRIAAPAWGVSAQLARAYIDSRCPSTLLASDYVEIGRVQINLGRHSDFVRRQSGTFAQTNYALRIMESIGVCVRQNEPVLLVGETGCGKTTMVQQLASICDRELIVQNLSLQTDSTDLLGGFKPLELKNVARKVYLDFVDLFCSSFSRKQNAKFLEFAASALEKESWKKLSQCFQKAAKLGLSQMKERIRTEEGTPSRKNRDLVASWKRFKDSSIKFERQIISCDAGLAFVFAEGALVDAIQHGKW